MKAKVTKAPKRSKEHVLTEQLENIYSVLSAWQDYSQRAGVSAGNAITSLLGHIDWSLVSRDTIVNVFSVVLTDLPEPAIAELSKHADAEREILIECGAGALGSDQDARLIRLLKKLRLRPKAFRAATRMIKAMAEDPVSKAGRK